MTTEMFAISTYCNLYNIDHAFITSLHSEGLIEITANEEGEFIEEAQLSELEKYIRWHHDLGINAEGIDVIRHLIQRIDQMQMELASLKSRLRIYEQAEPASDE